MSEKKKKTAEKCTCQKAEKIETESAEGTTCDSEVTVKVETAEELSEEKLRQAEYKYLRLLAEFDNFRKRTAKEKLSFTENAVCDTVKAFLPLLDNLQRAVAADGDTEALKKGVEMVIKQFDDILVNLGVEEIESSVFDPNFHNAVLHIDDEERGEGEIAEILQKGYKRGDCVLRHSMVKVAN